MKTLADIGGNAAEKEIMSHYEPHYGFQVFAPSGKTLAKPEQKPNLQPEPSYGNFNENLPGVLKGGSKGGKELEMMFDKVMNPEKYRKKYGHLERQNLMPPSYLQKKVRRGRGKDNEMIDFIETSKPSPQPAKPLSYFDSLGKGKSLADHQFSIRPGQEAKMTKIESAKKSK